MALAAADVTAVRAVLIDEVDLVDAQRIVERMRDAAADTAFKADMQAVRDVLV